MADKLELLRVVPGEFEAVIGILHPYESGIDDAKALLQRDFTHFDEARDTRFTVFSTLKNVIASTSLGLIYLERYLTDPNWWRPMRTIETSDLDRTIHVVEFHQFVKQGFVHISFSNIEAAIRSYVRALDVTACSGGAAEFKSIYEHLYRTRLNIGTDGIVLLDVLRLLRNTIHNGGVYVSRTGKDEALQYKGRVFDFKHGGVITFADWNTLATLHTDLVNLLVRTVCDSTLAKLPLIMDPRAGTLPPLLVEKGG